MLKSNGYTVMRFWEHDIKNSLHTCVNQIQLFIEAAARIKIPEYDSTNNNII
uniref:DUF559 domain-containing protein n=1 Tax=Pedobacter sp. TaxID=1411316 RepID=UPI002104FBAC|nr:DUF559 domain-containing protein [Pedobacter sp.]